jgi:hypothetical protein
VKTYTRALEDLDAGKLPQWSMQPVSRRGPEFRVCKQGLCFFYQP